MRYCTLVLVCVNAFFLAGCGIKPAYVDPPEGAKHDEFPRVYPDPHTDSLPPGLEKK